MGPLIIGGPWATPSNFANTFHTFNCSGCVESGQATYDITAISIIRDN